MRTAATSPEVSLLGMRLLRPEPHLGWIVTGRSEAGSLRPVLRFVEKPDQEVAAGLHEAGALCNSFVMVGSVAGLRALAREELPDQQRVFEGWAIYNAPEAACREKLRRVYRRLPRTDFSRAVLAKSRALKVVPVAGSGWSDWGTPDRVPSSLAGTDAL